MASCFVSTGQQCQVYIAVYGFTNSSYSIVANTPGNYTSPIWLVDGVSQTSTVNPGQYIYYAANVNVPPNTAYSFYMNPTYGDPDMCVSCCLAPCM